jgi:ABC-type lipoprotein export system ATPase subunit
VEITMSAFISCHQLVKAYRVGSHELVALRGIDFEMGRGEMVAIIGPSGAGKSSLLNLIGGLDTPTAGQVVVDGVKLERLRGKALAEYRLRRVGFLWQQVDRNLLAHRSAVHNVGLPMMIAGVPPWQRGYQARQLLNAVGLQSEHLSKRPAQLSGGQQQRVAIAVALANRPPLLLADEPTGALDRQSATLVMNLLQELRHLYGLTVLIVTHDMAVANYADRILTLRDGALGQDLSHTVEDTPALDDNGRLRLPERVRTELAEASRIAVEIRPEGILLRAEASHEDDGEAALQAMLPQDAPPERKGWWRGIFGQRKQRVS